MLEIPSFAQQVFQDSAAIPVDERPLIGLTPRFMKEHGFSDGESIAEVQMDAILAAGGIPVMMPLTDDDALIDRYVEMCDGFNLPGGQDVDPRNWGEEPRDLDRLNPRRDALEFKLVKKVYEADKPLFAICRGLQLLNVVFGGTLTQELRKLPAPREGHAYWSHIVDLTIPAHMVEVDEDSLLCRALGGEKSIQANSFHDEALCKVASELHVVAHSTDGIIEGAEISHKRWMIGVQWHPEYGWKFSKADCMLWKSFIDAAREYRASRPRGISCVK